VLALPDWLALLVYIAVPAAAMVLAHVAIRRIMPAAKLAPHHEVAGFLVAVIGVLYAVVLGFVVVTVWTAFDAAQQTADLEAGYVGDTYNLARALAEPTRTRVRHDLAAYALEVRDVEFASMAGGKQDPRALGLMKDAVGTLLSAQPASGTFGQVLRAESRYNAVTEALRHVADARRLRFIDAESRLPRAMYVALILGGLMVLVFVFLFGVESGPLQFTMTATVAGCIGLLIGLVIEFNAPFSGAIRVTPAAWSLVIENNQLASFADGAGR
jgi:hypothetical protein